MSLTFDRDNKLILVTAPTVTITVQDLVNAIREYEDDQENMDLPKIVNAAGKQSLGLSGKYVGITMELLDDWRIQFEERTGPDYTRCFVTDGNITAINTYNNEPVAPAAFTWVTIEQSTSPALITVSSNKPRAIPGR